MQKNTLDGTEKTQAKSTVGSVQGNVNIQAGKDVNIQASDVISGQNTKIIGADVNITAGMETSHEKQSYEYSKSGLTVSVSSPAIDTIQSISNKVDRASEVSDKRLAALYDVQAAQALSGLDKKIDNTVNGTSEKDDKGNDGKKVSDISLNVSLGSTSMQQNSTSDSMQAKGSQISAGKNLDIIATGTNKNDGNVIIQGSTVTGDQVHIQAVNDVTIESAENQTTNNTQTDGKSSGIGAQISAKGVGFYAEASKNKELENGTILTHTPSVVTAKDTLNIEAGHDVNILGSKASGDRVEVNAGNNLNLASQQDIDNYNEKSSSSGGKIGTAGIGLQGNASKGKIDSNYESVTTQAEIHAGQGGFNIEVGKNTDLKGAVISSDATPNKNKLSTDTLSYSDIKNKADYSASSTGGTFGIKQVKKPEQDSKGELTFKDQTIVTKSIDQGIPVKGSASTTTNSAIANGTIEVRSNLGQNLAGLNRETEKSLNALGKIFDKKKVQEKQELVNLFSQEANQLIGDLSLKKYQEALKKAEAEKGTPAYAGLLEEANKWKEGGINKILLHTAVGGITSGLSGDGFKTGAVSAGLNETLQKELSKINDPVLHQLASSIIGFVAAKAISGDTQTAGAINASATKNNFLNHYQQERFAELLAGAQSKEEKAHIVAYYTALSLYNVQNKLLGGDHDDEVVEPDLLDQLHHLDANIPGLNYALNDLTINMLTEYDTYNLANYYREKLNQTNGMYEYPVENFYGLDKTVVYTGPLTGVDTTPDPDVQKANELIAANGEIVVGEDGKKYVREYDEDGNIVGDYYVPNQNIPATDTSTWQTVKQTTGAVIEDVVATKDDILKFKKQKDINYAKNQLLAKGITEDDPAYDAEFAEQYKTAKEQSDAIWGLALGEGAGDLVSAFVKLKAFKYTSSAIEGSSKAFNWKLIQGTQPLIEGTNVPKSFVIKGVEVNGKEIWVGGNATKHIGEFVTAANNSGGGLLAENEIMESFMSAAKLASQQTLKLGDNRLFIGGWEIGINGETGVIYHALMK